MRDLGTEEKTQEQEMLRRKDGFKGETMIVVPIEAFSDYADDPRVRRCYLTDVGFFPKAAHHYIDRKDGCGEYIFIYCMEGSGTIQVNDKKYILHQNEAFTIPRAQRHRYYASTTDPWSILWVHIKGENLGDYPLDSCQIIKFTSIYASNRMLFLFELLFRVLDGNYTQGNFVYISDVLSLILSETYNREKENTASGESRYVTNIIRYMQKHLGDMLTLEDLEQEFELSRSYLNAIFKRHTQHAPLDFFNMMKMKEACRLLKVSNRYVYEIAQQLGYRDQYYFSRIFKKIVGVSPNEYKNGNYDYFTEWKR